MCAWVCEDGDQFSCKCCPCSAKHLCALEVSWHQVRSNLGPTSSQRPHISNKEDHRQTAGPASLVLLEDCRTPPPTAHHAQGWGGGPGTREEALSEQQLFGLPARRLLLPEGTGRDAPLPRSPLANTQPSRVSNYRGISWLRAGQGPGRASGRPRQVSPGRPAQHTTLRWAQSLVLAGGPEMGFRTR